MDAPAVLSWRIGVTEKLVSSKADKDAVRALEQHISLKADKEYVDTIADEVRGLRKAVIGAALTIMGSAVLVSLTLFATLGSHLAGG